MAGLHPVKKIAIDQFELATVDQGEGAPVVFVHGFPLDHTMWDAQIGALSSGYRVLAPDLRGFGQSSMADGTVTMEDFADDLAALLDAVKVGEPVVLCGLSMGGYIALEFWRRHSAKLRALVLCDTRSAADTPEAAAGRLATADRVLREGPAFLAETMIPKLFAARSRDPEREYVAATRHVILSTNPRGIAAAARGMSQRRDFAPQLAQIALPTLVIAGQEDAISTPEEMRGMAAKVPGARFVEIGSAGHMTPLEAPDEVTATLTNFLQDISESKRNRRPGG